MVGAARQSFAELVNNAQLQFVVHGLVRWICALDARGGSIRPGPRIPGQAFSGGG